jgi:hypothetical protein
MVLPLVKTVYITWTYVLTFKHSFKMTHVLSCHLNATLFVWRMQALLGKAVARHGAGEPKKARSTSFWTRTLRCAVPF